MHIVYCNNMASSIKTIKLKSPCIICGLPFMLTDKAFSLAAKAKDQLFSCGDVIDYLFKDLKILNGNLMNWEPTGNLREEPRYICQACLTPMKTAYVNLKTVMNRMSSDCMVKAHVKMDKKTETVDATTQTEEPTTAKSKPKKPNSNCAMKTINIRDIMSQINHSSRFRHAFYNCIIKVIFREVGRLGNETEGLKGPNVALREEDLNLDFGLIFQELSSKAPLLCAALQGAFNIRQRTLKDISSSKYLPPITAILAIILRFRTRKCILFQKYMSFMMYKKRSNMKKMSKFLFDFGFVCSWHSLKNTILEPMEANGNLQEYTENDGDVDEKEDEDPNSEVGNDSESDQDQDEIEATSTTETEIRGNPDMLIKDEVLSDASDVESGSISTPTDHAYQKKCPDKNQKECMNQSNLVDDQEIKTEPISPPCSPPSAKRRKEIEPV